MNSSPPSEKPTAIAVAFVRSASQPADKRGDYVQEQRALFHRFCERHQLKPRATFVDGPMDTQSGSADSSTAADDGLLHAGYTGLRLYLLRHPDVAAVAFGALTDLGLEEDDLALAALELDQLGAKLYLFDGRVIDPYSIVAGTWPEPTRTSPDMRERIKSAMRNRAMKGEGLGKPPYGYRIGPRKKLEVVPEEAETVKLIYSLYTQKDQGIRLIVRHLNEHSILTRKGKHWSMVTIRDILRNRAYLGTYSRFGMRVPGNHPAIVTPDVFRWTQSRLEERQPVRRNVQSEPFLLSGLIYCGQCGNRMMGVTRRQTWTRHKDGTKAEKEYRYYQCQSRTNQGICDYNTQNAGDFEQKVLIELQAKRPRLVTADGRRTTPAALAGLQRERRRLEAATEKMDLRLKRSIKQVRAGKLSLQRFKPLSAGLLETRRETLEQLSWLQPDENGDTTPTRVQQGIHAIDELSTNWLAIDFKQKRLLLTGLIDRIDVRNEGAGVTLRSPLNA